MPGSFLPFEALARDQISQGDHISHVKKLRAAAKATRQQNVEAVLSLHSALKQFGVSFDNFIWQGGADPMGMALEDIKRMNLLDQPVLVLMADREGSQILVIKIVLSSAICWPRRLDRESRTFRLAKDEKPACHAVQQGAHRPCLLEGRPPPHGPQYRSQSSGSSKLRK